MVNSIFQKKAPERVNVREPSNFTSIEERETLKRKRGTEPRDCTGFIGLRLAAVKSFPHTTKGPLLCVELIVLAEPGLVLSTAGAFGTPRLSGGSTQRPVRRSGSRSRTNNSASL